MFFINSSIFNSLSLFEGKAELFITSKTIKTTSFFILGLVLAARGLASSVFLKKGLHLISPESKTLTVNPFSNFEGLCFFGLKNTTSKDFVANNNLLSVNFFALKLEDTFSLRKLIYTQSKTAPGILTWWVSSFLSDASKKTSFILPTGSHFQISDFFLSLEQRPQKSLSIFKPFPKSRTLHQLFSKLFFKVKPKNKSLYLNYLLEMSLFLQLFEVCQQGFKLTKICGQDSLFFKVFSYPTKSLIEDFFLFGSFTTKSSTVMQNCSHHLRKKFINFF